MDHVHLLLHQVVIRRGQLQHLQQLLSVVHGTDLLTQNAVQEFADGERNRESHKHEELSEENGVRANRQTVAGTERLRDDLAKDDDADSRRYNGGQTGSDEIVEKDSEGSVHQHVPQEKRAQ